MDSCCTFLLLVNFVLLFGFFLTKKRPLPAKTIVFALGKGLLILAIIISFYSFGPNNKELPLMRYI